MDSKSQQEPNEELVNKITEQQNEGCSPQPEVQDLSGEDGQKDSEIPPHQLRVYQERIALFEKVQKLAEFIYQNPLFNEIPSLEQRLLKKQLSHMEFYLDILDQRIEIFEGKRVRPLFSRGEETIGQFGNENPYVFNLKYFASLYIDITDSWGRDPRRNNIVNTEMEKVQMMAVKSHFTVPKPGPAGSNN